MVLTFMSGTAVWLIVTLALQGLNRQLGTVVWLIVMFAFTPSSLLVNLGLILLSPSHALHGLDIHIGYSGLAGC
jgi:hypothetical protein